MKKKLLNLNEKGFSLIELMVVIAIIAILAAVGIPAYTGYQTKARTATVSATLNQIKTSFPVCLAANANDWGVCTDASSTTGSFINGTLSSQSGAVISASQDTSAGNQKGCWKVVSQDVQGCIEYNNGATPDVPVTTKFGLPVGTPCSTVPLQQVGAIDTCGAVGTPTAAGGADTCAGNCTPNCSAVNATPKCSGTNLNATVTVSCSATGDCS